MDKFYTKEKTVKYCLNKVKTLPFYDSIQFYVEPSAGCGAFYNLLPTINKVGYDVKPDNDQIKQQDFLILDFDSANWSDVAKSDILIIGNPPFGKRGKLALDFIDHSSKFADTIAFILPMNFRKYAMHKNINKKFSLIFQKTLPRNSFYLPETNKNQPQLFQVLEKMT